MRALTYHGAGDVRVDTVPDPDLQDDDDILLRVTATAICGSDLHLYRGKIPMVEAGDILGHEFMGIVEDVGSAVTAVRPGDRVVIPFVIACGGCFFCQHQLFAACETTNTGPGALLNKKLIPPGAALFGYSHLYGGIAGGRRGGVVSVPGVYAGFVHGFLFGDAFDKGLTFRMGQTHVHRYLPELLEHIEAGRLNPEAIVTHRLALEDAVRGYELFDEHQKRCRKVIMVPGAAADPSL